MIDRSEILTLLTEFQGCQKMLSAIGDEARQHIIIQMLASNHSGEARCGGMRVGEIAALSSLSRPAISHHLQILKDAGLLKMRREGTRNYYYFDADMVDLENLIQMLQHIKSIMLLLPDRSGENDSLNNNDV